MQYNYKYDYKYDNIIKITTSAVLVKVIIYNYNDLLCNLSFSEVKAFKCEDSNSSCTLLVGVKVAESNGIKKEFHFSLLQPLIRFNTMNQQAKRKRMILCFISGLHMT